MTSRDTMLFMEVSSNGSSKEVLEKCKYSHIIYWLIANKALVRPNALLKHSGLGPFLDPSAADDQAHLLPFLNGVH